MKRDADVDGVERVRAQHQPRPGEVMEEVPAVGPPVLLVDVRSNEERVFVGQVPGSVHVPWATGTSLTRNPRFVRELEAKAGKDKVILLLCRSGSRSSLAAEAATKAGLPSVFNVLEGFEGELDDKQQRGHAGGWRSYELPWTQQ